MKAVRYDLRKEFGVMIVGGRNEIAYLNNKGELGNGQNTDIVEYVLGNSRV